MNTLGSRLFGVQKDSKAFVAEMSDLNGVNLFNQLYADACDTGFAMESSRTGDKAVFYFVEEIMHGPANERELAGWLFKPTNETLRKMPHLKDWSVTVFND